MSSDTVTVEERRLAYEYTYELQQDMQSYHGLDAQSELMKMAVAEMASGEDSVIIDDLIANAGHNVNWSKTYPGTSSGYTRPEYEATLLSKAIGFASTAIFNKRGVTANRIAVSGDELERMNELKVITYDGDFEKGGIIGSGRTYVGTLKGMYKVYADPLIPSGTILVAHKGDNFARTGYV